MSRQEWMAVPPLSSDVKLSHGRLDKADTRLEDGYQPHPFDVICKRDRESVFHVGNNRFNLFVEMRVSRYVSAKKRNEKTAIIQEIIDAVHVSGGRFIRQEEKSDQQAHFLPTPQQREANYKVQRNAGYFAVGRKKIADKVGHAMRLAVSRREARSSRRSSWPVQLKAARNALQATFDWEGSYEQLQPGMVLARHVASEQEYKFNQDLAGHGLECHDLHKPEETGKSDSYPDAMLTVMANYRRQSWPAGTFDDEKCYDIAIPRNCQEDLLFATSNDLSFHERGLGKRAFQDSQACSVGNNSSIDFEASPRPLEMIADCPMVGGADPFDTDDLSWTSLLFS